MDPDFARRAQIMTLQRQLTDVRRSNAKLRDALLHTCAICRICDCPERERLLKAAFGRQLQTLRNPR